MVQIRIRQAIIIPTITLTIFPTLKVFLNLKGNAGKSNTTNSIKNNNNNSKIRNHNDSNNMYHSIQPV